MLLLVPLDVCLLFEALLTTLTPSIVLCHTLRLLCLTLSFLLMRATFDAAACTRLLPEHRHGAGGHNFEHASYNLKRLLLHAQTQLLLSIEVCRVCRGMQGWRARELCETVVLRSFPAFLHTLHTLHTFYEKVLYIYLYRVVGGGDRGVRL